VASQLSASFSFSSFLLVSPEEQKEAINTTFETDFRLSSSRDDHVLLTSVIKPTELGLSMVRRRFALA